MKKTIFGIVLNLMIGLVMLFLIALTSNLHEANTLLKKGIPAGEHLANAFVALVGSIIVIFLSVFLLRYAYIMTYWRKRLISVFVIMPWIMFYIIDFIFPGRSILLPTGISFVLITIFFWWMMIKRQAEPA